MMNFQVDIRPKNHHTSPYKLDPYHQPDICCTIPVTDQTPQNRVTILVADDDPDVVRLMRLVLEDADHTALTALDGESALATCKRDKNPVHLLIADIVLTGMPGPELAQRLYTEYPALSVIFITGYAFEQVAADIAPVPHAMLLMKPIRIGALARDVAKVLVGREKTDNLL